MRRKFCEFKSSVEFSIEHDEKKKTWVEEKIDGSKKVSTTSPSTVIQKLLLNDEENENWVWICGNYKIFCTDVPFRICVYTHTLAFACSAAFPQPLCVFSRLFPHRLNTKKKFFSISKYFLYLVMPENIPH